MYHNFLTENKKNEWGITSIKQLVENTVAQDIFLTVRLLPADFEGGRTESRKHQSAGGVWNTRGESCI